MSIDFLNKIDQFFINFKIELNEIKTIKDLGQIKKKYFAKNGLISSITDEFKSLTIEEKKAIGNNLQNLKSISIKLFNEKELNISLKESNFPEESIFDPSLNKIIPKFGKLHPYTIEMRKINNFFSSFGFEILDGNIIEHEDFNFTFLNIPKNHSARDEADTFWINNEFLLRTHTSAIQVKEARKRNPPFGAISFGFVYRNEATDASHDFMFAQLEGLYISKDASLSNLLYTIKEFFRFFFENDNLEIRVRPGLFPFVEPGMEIDLECPFCSNGCSTCKQGKWIELGGLGMVHPNVLKYMNIKNEEIKGWAFGCGLTRLIMLKYNINDIRLLHINYKI